MGKKVAPLACEAGVGVPVSCIAGVVLSGYDTVSTCYKNLVSLSCAMSAASSVSTFKVASNPASKAAVGRTNTEKIGNLLVDKAKSIAKTSISIFKKIAK